MRTGKYNQLAVSSFVAIALMAILYPYTFRAWFQADDLGWLGLGQRVVTFQDWLHAMFAPLAQGTIDMALAGVTSLAEAMAVGSGLEELLDADRDEPLADAGVEHLLEQRA